MKITHNTSNSIYNYSEENNIQTQTNILSLSGSPRIETEEEKIFTQKAKTEAIELFLSSISPILKSGSSALKEKSPDNQTFSHQSTIELDESFEIDLGSTPPLSSSSSTESTPIYDILNQTSLLDKESDEDDKNKTFNKTSGIWESLFLRSSFPDLSPIFRNRSKNLTSINFSPLSCLDSSYKKRKLNICNETDTKLSSSSHLSLDDHPSSWLFAFQNQVTPTSKKVEVNTDSPQNEGTLTTKTYPDILFTASPSLQRIESPPSIPTKQQENSFFFFHSSPSITLNTRKKSPPAISRYRENNRITHSPFFQAATQARENLTLTRNDKGYHRYSCTKTEGSHCLISSLFPGQEELIRGIDNSSLILKFFNEKALLSLGESSIRLIQAQYKELQAYCSNRSYALYAETYNINTILSDGYIIQEKLIPFSQETAPWNQSSLVETLSSLHKGYLDQIKELFHYSFTSQSPGLDLYWGNLGLRPEDEKHLVLFDFYELDDPFYLNVRSYLRRLSQNSSSIREFILDGLKERCDSICIIEEGTSLMPSSQSNVVHWFSKYPAKTTELKETKELLLQIVDQLNSNDNEM